MNLDSTDYAYPASADAVLLNADPYDSAWSDFDDRFRLDPGGDCVDGGDPASSVGSFYSTALARFADDGIVDIGYHYPRIVRFVKWDATGTLLGAAKIDWQPITPDIGIKP